MITNLDYASYFAYNPKPDSKKNSQHAQAEVRKLKRDQALNDGTCQSKHLVDLMSRQLEKSRLCDFFKSKPVLVPVPKSSPMKPDTLWVPQRIATSMAKAGLGSSVQTCLKRASPVSKSADNSQNRPKARDHYNSFSVEALPDVDDLVLVDDVVTRGATFLGAASMLKDRFPNARIRAFALICTRTPPAHFSIFEDPAVGRINLRSGAAFRSCDIRMRSGLDPIQGRTDVQTTLFSVHSADHG